MRNEKQIRKGNEDKQVETNNKKERLINKKDKHIRQKVINKITYEDNADQNEKK